MAAKALAVISSKKCSITRPKLRPSYVEHFSKFFGESVPQYTESVSLALVSFMEENKYNLLMRGSNIKSSATFIFEWVHVKPIYVCVAFTKSGSYFNGRFGYNRIVHDDVIKWKHFPRYWPLPICAGNSSVAGWIPRTKASDAELWCFLWSE